MNTKERQKFLAEQMEIIYDEYSTYICQLIALKPFMKDLIAVSKGKTPVFDLSEIIKESRKCVKGNKCKKII